MCRCHGSEMRKLQEWNLGPAWLVAGEINPQGSPPEFYLEAESSGRLWLRSLSPDEVTCWKRWPYMTTRFVLVLVNHNDGEVLFEDYFSTRVLLMRRAKRVRNMLMPRSRAA